MEKNFEARTEQEAIEQAVREFGVNAEFLEVEVLKKSKSNLFGKNGKVVIRASVLGLPSSDGNQNEYRKKNNEDDNDRKHYQKQQQYHHHEEEEIKEDIPQEMKDKICHIVQDLIKQIGMEITCSFLLEDNFYVVNLEVAQEEEQNLLIGKYGKNIDAIQNLSNSIIHNKIRDFNSHIVIDIEQYRAKRMEWLSSMARKKTEQVQQTGKSLVLEELAPFDRKMIHSVVRTFDGVGTVSRGNGYYKKIKIFPNE